jgi:hypothetical protein
MLALLVTLLLTPPAPDLDGTWRNDDGTTLAIKAGTITVTDADGFAFTSQLTVGRSMLRLADATSTLTRQYPVEGRSLLVGGVVYWRLALGER